MEENGHFLSAGGKVKNELNAIYESTDEGQHHYKQIADSAAFQVQEIQKYMASVIMFLEEKS